MTTVRTGKIPARPVVVRSCQPRAGHESWATPQDQAAPNGTPVAQTKPVSPSCWPALPSARSVMTCLASVSALSTRGNPT